jgi:hypothetical protein
MVDKRKTIELLPGQLQTETLSKVFSATVDHLFQPQSLEFLTGYVGRKPSWFDRSKDFYLSEPSKTREDYQLTPTIVSKDYQSGNITKALFYEDLLGQLRFQGALVDNHSRLFDQEYYSWCPPIDIDKLVNFTNYYWLPNGPDAVELLDTTDLANQAVGLENYTYTGAVKYTSTGLVESITLKFTSGLKIRPRADKTISFNNKDWLVEGVGRKIAFVSPDFDLNPSWDMAAWDLASWDGEDILTEKQYVTISRSSNDGNQWSQTNRWFHIDIVRVSKTRSTDSYEQQSRRPIIEFEPNMELWNYGTKNRGSVDVVDTITGDFLGTIVGRSEFVIDGVTIRDGMRILTTGDVHPDTVNRVFLVSGQAQGSIDLTLDTTDVGPDGSPSYGERMTVRFGTYQGMNLYFNGTTWTSSGQQKSGSTPPLFALYDIDGNTVDNQRIYPATIYTDSSFAGSKVFSYAVDPALPVDSELGQRIKLDQFGDYVFVNDLSSTTVTYTRDGRSAKYYGYLFAKIDSIYTNSWYKAPEPSKQYIVNEFLVSTGSLSFEIDQSPATQVPNTLPTITVSIITPDGVQQDLKKGKDYTVIGKTVSLIGNYELGSRVIVRSWSKSSPMPMRGYYEIPKNLSANPNNDDITTVSRSQFLQQFIEIIGNQTGVDGNTLGVNNYRDTKQNKGLGLSILQHRAPMLKLGVINTTRLDDITSTISQSDPMLAMQFAQRSYQRFYNRFLQALFSISTKQGYAASSSVTACDPYMIKQWVAAALKQINVGKTVASPWANSGPSDLPGAYCSVQSTVPTYVPASPTRLGITPAYRPVVFIDQSYTTPQMIIQTHDGSLIVMVDDQGNRLSDMVHGQASTTNPEELTNPVAAAWLQFELDLFNSLPAPYRSSSAALAFDIREQIPGKWRSSDYTREEVLKLQRSSFDKWVVANQVDFRANTGYQTTDQFSYNYRSVTDKQGQPVPGYWKGIYNWFFDTDRPHTHPWEMLGFSQKPDWWEAEYGPAPYTRGNTALWQDLRDGLIKHGPKAGTYSAWARPGLMDCIPVDDQGQLLPPYLSGCVATLPDVFSSKSEWIFGDGGPIESAWRESQDYRFVLAQTGYLMKPARFVEYTWDSLRTTEIFSETELSQWIYLDTNARRSSNEFYVHRETPQSLSIGIEIPNETNLSYFGSCGFQHWLSEYLISQSLSVTNYLGNDIRGADVQLAQRMSGYVVADSLRAMVDSFGEIGYNSQIVPGENVNVYLYRSTSIGESVYSGVIVEQVSGGWRLYGYDAVGQSFTIIPSNQTGKRSNLVIGNQRVVEYQTGLDKTETVMYGTVMTTRQAVYDFLVSYGRWLEAQGWRFDLYDTDSNSVKDWSQSAKEFLFWSQGSWENGTFITLSPGADSLSYKQDYGNIQYVNGIVAGSYPIVDRAGVPIQPQNVSVVRNDGEVLVRPINEQGIFGLRLYRTTLEHAVFFDNTTAFNDIIYNPLYDLKQERIKIYAYRTNDWNGRVDAPGYFLTRNQNTGTWSMAPNLDSTAVDIEKYFNIEQPKNFTEISDGVVKEKTSALGAVARTDISNISKHLIGYQNREYMQNLLLEDATQFEFYKGFIRQKGTKSTINRLLRNTAIIPVNSTFDYYEEWLIRVGYYGASSLNNIIGFRLPEDRITNDPQWIRLFGDSDSDYQGDDVLDIVPRDPLIVTPPESYQDKLFSLRKSYKIDPSVDLPTAGYVMLDETDWMVTNDTELLDLYDNQRNTLQPLSDRDTVWQFITSTGSWTVLTLTKALGQIDVTIPSQIAGAPTVIVTLTDHGLLDGDICVIYGVTGVSLINGTYVVSNVTPRTFQIDLSTYEQGTGGTILVYRPVRFANIFERDSSEPPGGWQDGDLAYVDDGGVISGAWTVYRRVQGNWVEYRQQQYKVDAGLIGESSLFDSITGLKASSVTYYDPAKGRISGRADAEISYKTDYDPAKYNRGNSTGYALSESEAWGNAMVGTVWWDLSTVRYIDYELGDDRYRAQHWGKIAPGTSVDVYEWVRSTVPPTDWSNVVAEGQVVVDGSYSFIPSGTIRNQRDPSWTEIVEYGPGGTSVTYYYYWVKNSAMPPRLENRSLTTQNIANLIVYPSTDDSPWFAAISSKSIIVSNIRRRLDGDKIIQQISYSSTPNSDNIYGEWELIREGDRFSPIGSSVWLKLKDSLTTFDGLGNDVPDYKLNSLQKYGSTIRPRQTWFVDRTSASKVFVDTVNEMLASSSTPMIDNPSMLGWMIYFDAAEPTPPKDDNWDYQVATIADRDALVGAITLGSIVLVDPVSTTGNLWTMWRYVGGTEQWVLERRQAYNTANYWSYVDWYMQGFGPLTTIDITVNTVQDLQDLERPAVGTIAKVLNNGANKWQLFSWNGQWTLVGQQDGNVEISESIYLWEDRGATFDSQLFDSAPFDLTAATEFSYIIDGIKNAIYSEPDSLELNMLFFAMINYVVSEQSSVDWLIKTSNITLKGFNQPLLQSKILAADNIESIVGFINESKPYHAKIREFVSGKSSTDAAFVGAVDFDNPPVDLAEFNASPPTLGSAEESYYSTYMSWLRNYVSSPQLIRTLSTTLIFDRISTLRLRQGWGIAWDLSAWEDTGGQNFGAIDRIDQFYNPTEGMLPKVMENLMSGIAYKGIRLSALGFNVEIGWGIGPWGGLLAWDVDQTAIEEYLDQIIQGGMIPNYDASYGNGITKIFPILKDVSNPHDIVVWSDGELRLYGVDWIVRTYAQSVVIVEGGAGYAVGDQLDLIAGSGVAATRVQVTSVNLGSITGIKILGRGSYTTVLKGPYTLEYPVPYPGFGSGATVWVDWKCSNIEFFEAPASSSVPNIYSLYIGTTFGEAPENESDTSYDGNKFVQPFVDDEHPEELYPVRLRDAAMIDVMTARAGGRPLVSSKVYETDGITEQYDIGVIPQSDSAVIAYLNGNQLTPGPSGDFVINFDTGRLVFITPPASGILQVTAISTGGNSRSVKEAFVVESGSGYLPGDIVTVITDIGPVEPQIRVSSVKAVSVSVVDGGLGYNNGDTLLLNASGGSPVNGNLTIVKVTSVGQYGNILTIEITQAGEWSNIPPSLVWNLVGRSQAGTVPATISVTWGARTGSVINAGLLSRIPDPSIPLTSLAGSGIGATWNLLFYNDLETYTYVGNGATTDYFIPNKPDLIPQRVLAVVDGRVEYVTGLTGGIRFFTPPPYGSKIILTVFNTVNYSTVTETNITVTDPLVTSYSIPASSYSTIPLYESMLVRQNGYRLTPPLMEVFKGNGSQLSWTFDSPISGALGVFVYVDQILQVIGVDVTFTSSAVTFAQPPADMADIVVLAVMPDTDFTVSGQTLTLRSGLLNLADQLSITTYSEDIDYEFATETFDTNAQGIYFLTSLPYDLSTISVWQDGVLKSPMIDYRVDPDPAVSGWGVVGWDLSAWDIAVNSRCSIVMPGGTIPSKVVVTYMVGLPQRPAAAWRMLLSQGEQLNTVLDQNRETVILSNVYTFSSSIEIEDYTKISSPEPGEKSFVYINNELIAFTGIQVAPTVTHPNRAFIVGLQRNMMGTSGEPRTEYNVQFYNGDGSTIYFATEAAAQAITETVLVNDRVQIQGVDYVFEENPPLVPAGRYVRFASPPAVGYKSVKIVSLNRDSSSTNLSHVVLSTVIDAGNSVRFPEPYQWEPAPFGLQYSRSRQAAFILDRG